MTDTTHRCSLRVRRLRRPARGTADLRRPRPQGAAFRRRRERTADRACWALPEPADPPPSAVNASPTVVVVAEFADVLRVRLSELDLRLRIVDELQIAFVEQVGYESRWGRRLLKRETINTPTTLSWRCTWPSTCVPRARTMCSSPARTSTRCSPVSNTIDRDLAAFDKRIDRAVDKMEKWSFCGLSAMTPTPSC